MRGLKKRKSAEYTQRQATPISLDMLRVRHSHLVIAPGFTEASRLRFFAVPALAFYGMCLINEVFSLKRKNPTLGLTRPSTSDAEVSSTYGAYKLEGRKAEVAEGRCNNMHHLDDSESSTDVLSQLTTWLTLSKISKSVIKTDDSSPGCENARVEWGKKMLNRHSLHCSNVLFEISIEMGCPRVGTFDNNGATSGSPLTRSAALPLRMAKWWVGWTQNEPAETLLRYLLDQAATDEDTQLVDCLAPDRESHVGCPTTFSRCMRNTTTPARQPSSSIEKEAENELNTREGDQRDECRADIYSPPAKDWKDMDQMYWTADAARHLFKPVSECKSLERKKSDVLPSRSSVAKLIAEDVRAFTIQKGTLSPRNAADSTLSTYAAYYTEHWLKDTAELNVLTIDTLARYIRFDRKRRLVKSKHVYL
ncbi:hypothetical protein GQ600_7380 [Phytophthora cactorum]|nr:hypothetical protein GQ600_7380 [Phytophthora cactorum]